jgi:putative transposase
VGARRPVPGHAPAAPETTVANAGNDRRRFLSLCRGILVGAGRFTGHETCFVNRHTHPMHIDHPRPRRRTIRLQGYDYAQAGAYFVTICAEQRACRFGAVVDDEVRLTDAGRMVADEWNGLVVRYPCIEIDAFVVMPNHLHGLMILSGARPSPDRAPNLRAPGLGTVVGSFKSTTTVRYTQGVREGRWKPFVKRLWQRSYYEHVVRSERGLASVRQYIADNPLKWALDRENPGHARHA